MNILLNNREESFSGETITVAELLEVKKYSFKMRIIKINGKFIPKEEYETTIIHEGDDVKMFYLMSGG